MIATFTGTVRTLAAALAVTALAAHANAAELVSVETPESGQLTYLLELPDAPTAAVILFAGGNGLIGLSAGAFGSVNVKNPGNFLVRTRDKFAAHGFAVAVVDTPRGKRKMNAVYRMSAAHAGDIAAVADDLARRADVPLWLIGTSMGTFSAPNGALALKDRVKGLVVTSSITRSPERWSIHETHPNGIIDMGLGGIAVPVLVTSHRDDGCDKTPAADADKLAAAFTGSPKTEVMIFTGGDEPISDPCNAKSQHGYFGIETEVVDAIAAFIKEN